MRAGSSRPAGTSRCRSSSECRQSGATGIVYGRPDRSVGGRDVGRTAESVVDLVFGPRTMKVFVDVNIGLTIFRITSRSIRDE